MKRKITAIILMVVLVLALAMPMAAVGASNGSGLVAQWHFDGDALDSSGNTNDGTLMGDASFVPGYFGNAVSFDGSGDHVVVADDDTLSVGTALTVEAWVKPTATPSGYELVVGKWNDNLREYMILLSDGKVRFYAYYSGIEFIYGESSTTLLVDTWYHVAGVYDGANLQVYIDGSADGSPTAFSASIPNTTARLTIGEQYWKGTWWRGFTGLIDEVRIWDTATPSFNLEAEPETDFNLVGTTHTVTATVTPNVAGVPVVFDIDGPDTDQDTTVYTDANGEAELTIDNVDNGAGVDEITVSLPDGYAEAPVTGPGEITVTKYWVDSYGTIGGKITQEDGGKKKDWAKITYGGWAGLAGTTTYGELEVTFHNVSKGELVKTKFVADSLTIRRFWNTSFDEGDDDLPAPPPSDFNKIEILAHGSLWNMETDTVIDSTYTLWVNAVDTGEPGRDGIPDSIRFQLSDQTVNNWKSTGSVIYDTADEFLSIEETAKRTPIDAGNIQVVVPPTE